ncbi:MAG: DUF6524 family protein [Pseudomonadota bacterium]
MGLFGFLLRLVFTNVLVFASFNPTGTSYYHWVLDGFETDLPLKALTGIALIIGYVITLRATLRSIGPIGVSLVLALLGAIAWVLFDYGILTTEDPGLLQWLGLAALALVLAIGLCWSHIRRMITGQADIDDVDE